MATSAYADQLSLLSSAIVLRIEKPLADKDVISFFNKSVKTLLKRTTLISTIRASIEGGSERYSLLIFAHSIDVHFLPDTPLKDRVHGFVLLLEQDALAALLSKGVGSLQKHLPSQLIPLEYSSTLGLFAGKNARYESISLRTLGAAKDALLSRSYSALNLQAVMPRAGSRRSAPTALKVTRNGESSRLHPSTGRVSRAGGRASLSAVFDLLRRVSLELKKPQEGTFIEAFAQPLSLKDLPPTISPTAILFHWHDVEDRLVEDSLKVRRPDGSLQEARALDYQNLKMLLTVDVRVAPDDSGDLAAYLPTGALLGTLKKTVTAFSVTSATLASYVIIEDNVELPLDRLISTSHAFTLTFNDPTYSYTGTSLFRNRRLPEELPTLLSCFLPIRGLTTTTSEKGKPGPGSTAFPAGSLFNVIEKVGLTDSAIMICDDLGNEWADHIVLRSTSVQEIEFIHSKWREPTRSSASAFHEIISQAIKNLGNLTLPGDAFARKCVNKWSKRYKGTKIRRIRSGHTPNVCKNTHEQLRANVATRHIMSLATPFISKANFAEAANRLSAEQVTQPETVQLIWFLSSFADICRANGVLPRVYCAP